MNRNRQLKETREEIVARRCLIYDCHFRLGPAGGYTASFPKLPPVVAYGATLKKARANAQKAIEAWLDAKETALMCDPPWIPPEELFPI